MGKGAAFRGHDSPHHNGGRNSHADDIAAFIRGLNAGPVDLVGWSYSGLIVMLVTVQHPELVHSLTIHEPGSVSFVTDPASLKIAGEERQAMLAPAIAAAKAATSPAQLNLCRS
jgi:pimeloyl-ACP methyl ester carboxylesterase